MRKGKQGFTLIELMIVIAIIAIIAAIAIPGLLSSQRASNERNASTSLKTLSSAEADFRANDRDWNHVNDFWTGDVKGLYTMTSAGVRGAGTAPLDPPIKLIEVEVAAADVDPARVPAGGENMALPQPPAARKGYWYVALLTDLTLKGTEEESYKREVAGEEKEQESLGALLRARSVLKRRYGTAYVSFGEPISLAQALGPTRERLASEDGNPSREEDMRRFTQRLGFRLLREVNAAAVAGASSISATALLGAPEAACRQPDFLTRVNTLVDLLRAQGVCLTASLERNLGSKSRESLGWLESGGLVEKLADSDGAVIHVPPEKRFSLDFYKNNTIHFFLVPSLLTCALLREVPIGALRAHLAWWLDLYRWEFPLPEREQLATEIAGWLTYYRENGAMVGDVAVRDHPIIRATEGLLENFREAYLVAARTVSGQREWPIAEKALVQQMRKQFRVNFLLDEVRKPEANSVITFGNALSRLAELGYVTITRGGRSARERWADRGPSYDRLPELIRHVGL